MRRCFSARAVLESLEASGIAEVRVVYHHERLETPERMFITYEPLPIPPTVYYARTRGGDEYELVGMPGRPRP